MAIYGIKLIAVDLEHEVSGVIFFEERPVCWIAISSKSTVAIHSIVEIKKQLTRSAGQ